MLTHHGILSTSLVEAVEYFRSGQQVDAVLLDMCMPVMDGTETFRALREVDPDVRVLLASGYTVQGQARRLIDEGARGFLQKPFLPETLIEKIRAVFEE